MSFGFALVGAVVGEFLGSRQGVGLLISTAQGAFNANGVFAAMIIAPRISAFAIIARSASRTPWSALRTRRRTPSGIDPQALCFEITETAAISNFVQASAIIGALKALGCRFALDDFGSGLSSFGYLKNLPVDFLKLNGAFIRDITTDPVDRAMLGAIHDVGRALGFPTITEWVKTDAIREEVRRLGIDYAQGYGIERPRPVTDVTSTRVAPPETAAV